MSNIAPLRRVYQSLRFNPLSSLFVTIANALRCRIHFLSQYNGTMLTMSDQKSFTIFRHVIVGFTQDVDTDKGAIFRVQFQLDRMSNKRNKSFSRIPIPFFIGLPGFRAKFWMCSQESGYNQGIYQWATAQDAQRYAQSFAMRFMLKRSTPGTVSYDIIPDCNIYDYVDSLLPKNTTNQGVSK